MIVRLSETVVNCRACQHEGPAGLTETWGGRSGGMHAQAVRDECRARWPLIDTALPAGYHHVSQRRSSDRIVGVRRVRL